MAMQSSLSFITIDRSSSVPIYLQLENEIRNAVLTGALAVDVKLPSTRQLALDLNVSRIPVQSAYEQLTAEGFLTSKQGAGTFISKISVENLRPKTVKTAPPEKAKHSRLSKRSEYIKQTLSTTRLEGIRPFRPGIPGIDLFPKKAWMQSWNRAVKISTATNFGYGNMSGSVRLRNAIAQHIRDARGVNCTADQIIITGGAQQAFSLISFSLLDPGVAVWLEDPGHIAIRDAMTAMSSQVFPVPIDPEGIDIVYGCKNYVTPKLIFTTPSHQHPLGTTMSLQRRINLLSYAHENDAWVIEDDYDSEFRYKERPLVSLQGLDQHQVVIYVGSFSKTLFPGVRLGYIVAPVDLVDVFKASQGMLMHGCCSITQEAVADFMELGHYEIHIHKMRKIYKERSRLLVSTLQDKAGKYLEVSNPSAGMHLLAHLKQGDPTDLCNTLWQQNIDALPLTIFATHAQVPSAIVLGFACAKEVQIIKYGEKIAQILEEKYG